MNKKRSLVLLIIWMFVIFNFSHADSVSSSSLSQGLTSFILSIFNSGDNVLLIEKFNIFIRKLAHISEYFILCMFAYNYLRFVYNDFKKICLTSFLITFIYALSDEFHQLFIYGRSGSFIDVLIDVFGSFLFISLMFIIKKYASSRKSS